MAYRIRVNTKSKKIASFTKIFLERRFKYPFEIAMSSRNYLMLDVDIKDEEILERLIVFAQQFVNAFGGEMIFFETPNGYHLFHTKFLTWSKIQGILRALLKEADFYHFDKAHIEASLRRGYMTLRMNGVYLFKVTKEGVDYRE